MVFTNYHAPADYRRPAKTIEKIYVPVNDYPEINFSKLTLDSIYFDFYRASCLPHVFFKTSLTLSIV